MRRFYYFLAVISNPLAVFFCNFWMAKNNPIEEFGLFTLTTSASAIFSSLFLFGQASAITITYFSDERKGNLRIKSEIISSLLVIFKSFLLISVALIFFWYAFFKFDLSLDLLLIILVASLSVCIQLFLFSLTFCFDLYKSYFYASAISAILMSVGIFLRPNIETYFISQIFFGLIASILIWPKLREFFKRENKKLLTNHEPLTQIDLIKLGWVAIPGMLISSAYGFADKLILNHFLDLKAVAIYGIAATLSLGVGRLFISGILRPNTVTFMQHLRDSDNNAIAKEIKKVNLMIIFFILSFAIAYLLYGRDFILYFFGSRYIDGYSIIFGLFITVMIEGLSQFLSQVMLQKKFLKEVVFINAILLVFNCILNLVLVPYLGIKGIVLSFFITSIIGILTFSYCTNKINKSIGYPFATIFLTATLFLTISVISF